MDPVSATANIVAIVQAANRVITLCKKFLEAVRDAPSDIRLVLVEISTLRAVLDNLHFLASESGRSTAALDALARDHGPIEGCRKAILELEHLLPSESILSTESKTKALLSAISWTLKDSKAKALLDELRGYKSTITLALTTDSVFDLKDIKASTDEIQTATKVIRAALSDVQRQQLNNWLQVTDTTRLHEKACAEYEPGTGEWLFRSPEWFSWLEEETRCLWVHGIPGAGKTVLASHLIETVKDHCLYRGPSYACAYYYCYFGHAQDEARPMLRSVIAQLCRQLRGIPVAVYDLYLHGGEPSLTSLLLALEEVVSAFDRVFVFIDAVDESSPRQDLLRVLRDLAAGSRFDKLRVLATSREYIDIEDSMSDISAQISMRNSLLDQDIARYVRAKLDQHSRMKRWPEDLRDMVLDALSTKANGMTLDETYERILLNMPEESRVFVQHVLQWLSTHRTIHQVIPGVQHRASLSRSPVYIPGGDNIPCPVLFEAVEKTLASADADEGTNFCDYALDDELLRELCGCLITVTKVRIRDGSTTEYMSDVTFAHYTVLEFLESSRIRRGAAASFALDRERVMAEHAKVLVLGASATADRWSSAWPDNRGIDFYDILASMGSTTWLDPVLQLLDTHAAPRGSYFWYTPTCLEFLENPISPAITAFLRTRETKFLEQPPEPHFENLVRMLQLDESGSLSRAYLASLGRLSDDFACQVDLEFQSAAFFEPVAGNVSDEQWRSQSLEILRFKGSVLEWYAHLPGGPLAHQGLYKMLEFAAGHFDPSTIMLLTIANHQHDNIAPAAQCGGCLVLKHLLRLGAQATVPGYAVGSLQIAVARRDLAGTGLLLEAGVDPNDIGDVDGEIGTPDRGPILRWASNMWSQSSQKATYESLAAILIQYGARDFTSPMGEDPSRSRETPAEEELAST
ncbi:6876165c-5d0b-49cc-8881-80a601c66a56 [Thermothielavioides terrestris]|uniref:6876165c-5d0b-49cc-8881-80a601c66a56 n=1 Tax=Thermothielavioides terrestris TaxID=2587410 RepID=A0A446B7A2_9PEZI|nr:6876165c-5d0b-49cc-8881-80a601c66a56 [Thermothielavioides terrestris]